MNRIFRIQLNTDDFGRGLLLCRNLQDKADFIDGFQYGYAGGDARSDMPARWQDGFTIGSNGYRQAVKFQESRSEMGKRSAASRSTRVRTHDEHVLEHQSEQVIEPSEEASKLVSIESEEASQPDAGGMRAPDDLKKLKGLCRKSNARKEEIHHELEGILNEYGYQRAFKAAKQVPWDNRWPSEIRNVLKAQDESACKRDPTLEDESAAWTIEDRRLKATGHPGLDVNHWPRIVELPCKTPA
jgi:hypothetical protein